MDLKGRNILNIKKKNILNLKKKDIKIALILSSIIVLWILTSGLTKYIRAKQFFKDYPERVVIWEESADQMLDSATNRFLGKNVDLNVYEVVPGFHYWKIAQENSVDIDTIIGCNPFIKSLFARVGDRIIAVNKKGALHYVKNNEQVDILAELYDVEAGKIKKNNRIGLFRRLRTGDVVFIPDGKPKVVTKDMDALFKRRRMFKVPTNGWVAGRPYGVQMHPIYKVRKFHKGIDMKCSEGTPIFAAAPGIVIYAGGGGTYGKLIKIEHPNSYETRYAHCSKIYVKIGQEVKDHQCIGRVGSTGVATTAHLHFEIRTNGKPVDPMKFLW
ncbi:MAG: M23 family metallopeptidase [Spirochaetes bacterium]|nr:M23 family metallopeptidase [Spirochaetota bacterium]